MKDAKRHLEKLKKVKRKVHHQLIHKIHKEHKISKKTLFYVKEYGPRSNVARTIIKESIKVLLIASIISSIGGLALENIKVVLTSITPFIILLPVLNSMIGDYGIITSARFSTMLHEGKAGSRWWANDEFVKLLVQIMTIAVVTAVLSSIVAFYISLSSGHYSSLRLAPKIYFTVLIDVAVLVSIVFLISIMSGFYFYKKGEDPNNFLIPITTSVADFGNMMTLSLLIVLFF